MQPAMKSYVLWRNVSEEGRLHAFWNLYLGTSELGDRSQQLHQVVCTECQPARTSIRTRLWDEKAADRRKKRKAAVWQHSLSSARKGQASSHDAAPRILALLGGPAGEVELPVPHATPSAGVSNKLHGDLKAGRRITRRASRCGDTSCPQPTHPG